MVNVLVPVANLFLFPLPGSQGGVREEEAQAQRGFCAVRRPPGVCVHVTTSCGRTLRCRNRYIWAWIFCTCWLMFQHHFFFFFSETQTRFKVEFDDWISPSPLCPCAFFPAFIIHVWRSFSLASWLCTGWPFATKYSQTDKHLRRGALFGNCKACVFDENVCV